MSLREKIENNLAIWLLSALLAGFMAGIGTYKTVLEMAQLEVVSKAKLDALAAQASATSKPTQVQPSADQHEAVANAEQDVKKLPQGSSDSIKEEPSKEQKQPTIGSSSSLGSKPSDSVLVQEYERFRIEVVGARLVGTSITFELQITNAGPSDSRLFLAGNDGGNYGFLGFYSNVFIGGNRYVASEAHIAGEGGGRALVTVPGGGQAVRASLKFDGVPSSTRLVERLNMRVSTGEAYPSSSLPFGPIEIKTS